MAQPQFLPCCALAEAVDLQHMVVIRAASEHPQCPNQEADIFPVANVIHARKKH